MRYINKADLTQIREKVRRAVTTCFCALWGVFSLCLWASILCCTAWVEFYSVLGLPSPMVLCLSTSSPALSVSVLTSMFAFSHWLVCFMIISGGVLLEFLDRYLSQARQGEVKWSKAIARLGDSSSWLASYENASCSERLNISVTQCVLSRLNCFQTGTARLCGSMKRCWRRIAHKIGKAH